VWSSPSRPGSPPAGCGDASLFTWFLAWPAYALPRARSLLLDAIFHPAGIDLLSNTSVLAIGYSAGPVTWLFGPVATLNVASTLAPACRRLAIVSGWCGAGCNGLRLASSAVCWYWICRPFAFSRERTPVVDLMTAVLVRPCPLIVGTLDDILCASDARHSGRDNSRTVGRRRSSHRAAQVLVTSSWVRWWWRGAPGPLRRHLAVAEDLRGRLPHGLRRPSGWASRSHGSSAHGTYSLW